MYLVSNDRMDYISTKNFAATASDSVKLSAPDSLFLNVYEASFTANPPATIQVIYWRDLSKKDRLASLKMELKPEGQYAMKP